MARAITAGEIEFTQAGSVASQYGFTADPNDPNYVLGDKFLGKFQKDAVQSGITSGGNERILETLFDIPAEQGFVSQRPDQQDALREFLKTGKAPSNLDPNFAVQAYDYAIRDSARDITHKSSGILGKIGSFVLDVAGPVVGAVTGNPFLGAAIGGAVGGARGGVKGALLGGAAGGAAGYLSPGVGGFSSASAAGGGFTNAAGLGLTGQGAGGLFAAGANGAGALGLSGSSLPLSFASAAGGASSASSLYSSAKNLFSSPGGQTVRAASTGNSITDAGKKLFGAAAAVLPAAALLYNAKGNVAGTVFGSPASPEGRTLANSTPDANASGQQAREAERRRIVAAAAGSDTVKTTAQGVLGPAKTKRKTLLGA